MTIPTIEPTSEESSSLPPARRRRQRRMILPEDMSERGEFLRELAREVIPSFDFFLFSLLSGVVLGVALLADAPALAVLAALLAPFMAPMMGICLGSLAGSPRFTLQSLGSLLIGSLIVFLCGAAAGWAVNLLPGRAFSQVQLYSRFNWPYFVVLLVGVVLTAYLTVRARHARPLVSSVAIAYGLYLPLGAAGFSLTGGPAGLWAGALGLFLVHLVSAALIGMLALVLSGLRPLNPLSYVLGGAYAAGAVALVLLVGAQQAILPQASVQPAQTAATPPVSPVVQAASQLPSATSTPARPSETPRPTMTESPAPTPTHSLVPTRTATVTITPAPTPVWARISASEGGGALVREEPNYIAAVVSSLLNETLVEVLPEVTENGGVAWVRVRLLNGKEGWIVRSLLRTATPAPNW